MHKHLLLLLLLLLLLPMLSAIIAMLHVLPQVDDVVLAGTVCLPWACRINEYAKCVPIVHLFWHADRSCSLASDACCAAHPNLVSQCTHAAQL